VPNYFRGNFSIHEVPPELQRKNAVAQSLAVVACVYYFLLPKSTKFRVFWRKENPDTFHLVRSQTLLNLQLSLLRLITACGLLLHQILSLYWLTCQERRKLVSPLQTHLDINLDVFRFLLQNVTSISVARVLALYTLQYLVFVNFKCETV